MIPRHTLRRLFGRILTPSTRPARSVRRAAVRRRRPALGVPALVEVLEDRTLLTAYVVDSTDDTAISTADGQLTLREAVIAANTNTAYGDAAAGSADGDRITFSNNLNGATITQTGPLFITDDLRIIASSLSNGLRISGGNATQIFNIDTRSAGTSGSVDGVLLRNLTLVNGNAGTSGQGGAIRNSSSPLTIDGGAIYGSFANSGGAVANFGANLSVTNTVIGGNTATRAGGGLEIVGGNAVLQNVSLQSNIAGPQGNAVPGNGGGLHTAGRSNVTVTDGFVRGNAAANEGGGLWAAGSANLTVNGTTIASNTATFGGGVYVDDTTSAITNYRVNLTTLNNSGVVGNAQLTLDQTDPNNPTLTVRIRANGLEPNQPHVQHIHGRFLSNLNDPNAANGPFFIGEGEPAVNSVLPTVAANDTNGDGFIDFMEGRPAYGPVILNLDNDGPNAPPDGVPPLSTADASKFPTAPNGSVDYTNSFTFDLSDQDQRRQFNNLLPLDLREIVLHGLTTNLDIDQNGQPDGYRPTAPIAAGEIVQVTPTGTTTINGGAIRSNRANVNGGGLYSAGNLVVSNATIASNVAAGNDANSANGGGGIYNDGGSLQVSGTGIFSNRATSPAGSGGGVFIAGGENIQFANTTLSGNVAVRAGGGIETVGAIVSLTDSSLVNNVAGPNGNGAPGNGGGLHAGGSGYVTLTNGSVNNNIAANEGGGLWASATSTLIVNGSTVANNRATDGGGIYVQENDSTTQLFAVNLTSLNNSGVTGRALLTLDTSNPVNPLLNVRIQASGLVPNQPHPQHIHGRFLANLSDPDAANGPFFRGEGQAAVDSVLPTVVQNDTNGDGVITVPEGRPAYGPVILNLTSPQTPAASNGVEPISTADLSNFPTAPNGSIDFSQTYAFDLRDQDQRRQYNNLIPLALREIVLHGTTTNRDLNGDGQPDGYVATLPAAAGEIQEISATGSVQVTGQIRGNRVTGSGGGIFSSGDLTVINTRLAQNVAEGNDATQGGGGIYNNGGSLTIGSATIVGNRAIGTAGSGGGIFTNSFANFLPPQVSDDAVLINNSFIANNSANRAGGGIEIVNGSLRIRETSLDSNTAGPNGQANPGNGGGLHVSGSAAQVVLNGGQVRNNFASNEGGGLWNQAGSTLTLVNNVTVAGNIAGGSGGGGIYNNGGRLNATDTVFNRNAAFGPSTGSSGGIGDGGGVYNAAGSIAFLNRVRITGNAADRNGGGIYNNARLTLSNSFVADNQANSDNDSNATGSGDAIFTDVDGLTQLINNTITGSVTGPGQVV